MTHTEGSVSERYFLHYDGDREREVTRELYVLTARITSKQNVSGPDDDPVADHFSKTDDYGWVKGRIFRVHT